MDFAAASSVFFRTCLELACELPKQLAATTYRGLAPFCSVVLKSKMMFGLQAAPCRVLHSIFLRFWRFLGSFELQLELLQLEPLRRRSSPGRSGHFASCRFPRPCRRLTVQNKIQNKHANLEFDKLSTCKKILDQFISKYAVGLSISKY